MDRSPLNIGHPEKVTKLGKLPTCPNRTELGVAQNMDLCSQNFDGRSNPIQFYKADSRTDFSDLSPSSLVPNWTELEIRIGSYFGLLQIRLRSNIRRWWSKKIGSFLTYV